MPTPILTTKLYIPPPRPKVVSRARLTEHLNAGLHRKLTLISAPAGFGKTTLVSAWLTDCARPAAWVSLDEGDNAPPRFLTYLIAALQTLAPTVGEDVLGALQSPQPASTEAILTALLNAIATMPEPFVLVLDDYHVIDAQPVDAALAFLVEHLPPQMHLVIATREDPQLPLARLRVRDQMTELRVADLRFTQDEAADFLNQMMGLNLTADDIAALEARTEGWIAGLQLAAISMQGHKDAASFVKSFTGSHHFVMDYLVEEVLHQQPANVQTFLLRTSILDRLCGPLCEAVLGDAALDGQATLEYIQHANLFVVPLDNERRWYRYHHLFADLLRQRLQQSLQNHPDAAEAPVSVAELHLRASRWYEANGQDINAFHHAVAAQDIGHAARLMEGGGMPLHFRGAVMPVLNWLASLPEDVLDARPSLWVMYASALSMTGQTAGVEQRLQAAEAALENFEPDAYTRNLIGHIAAIRALLAAGQYQVQAIIDQSQRALEYLHPDNLPVRTATIWKLGIAYHLQGDRAAARQAYAEAYDISAATGNTIIQISATLGLGNIQELDMQFHQAAQTYQQMLDLIGVPQQSLAIGAHLGLAQIHYEWNRLDVAAEHIQHFNQLARFIEKTDRSVTCDVIHARLKLAQGDIAGAAAILADAERTARQHNFLQQLPGVAAAQVLLLLRQGDLPAAAQVAQSHNLPRAQARVNLAQGELSTALAILELLREQFEAKGWIDERLKVIVLQALTYHAQGERERAVHLLGEALALGEPDGLIRTFVDEGSPMARLLSEASAYGLRLDYVRKLLAICAAEGLIRADHAYLVPDSGLIESLSERELEILELIAEGLSNQEIGERLFLALSTVKGHNRNIYGKLQVQRRTEAVARARELGLV